MSTAVTVWIIQAARPWLSPERFQALLKTTSRGASWALVARLGGRRFKIGSTAFLTPEAAERRRLGLCAANLQPARARTLDRLGARCVIEASGGQRPPRVFINQLRG
jgi:hypothetical protein